MNERFLISKYIKEAKYPVSLVPVDLYFLKHRAESATKSNSAKQEPKIILKSQPKPNYLKKLDYDGLTHILPVNPISQIFDPEKFI